MRKRGKGGRGKEKGRRRGKKEREENLDDLFAIQKFESEILNPNSLFLFLMLLCFCVLMIDSFVKRSTIRKRDEKPLERKKEKEKRERKKRKKKEKP